MTTTIKHILFPYDFSPQGRQVAHFVGAFARRFGATVTLFGVVPPIFDASQPAMYAYDGETSDEWRKALQLRLDGIQFEELADVTIERVADSGDPAFRITEYAHTRGVDLIMMHTHGHGVFRNVLVGSVTAKVLHDAQCPVWTAAHAETQRVSDLPKTILCALDGTPENVTLLRWAADFAAQLGANLRLLHVVGSVTDWPSLESERKLQDDARREAHARIEALQAQAGVSAPLRVEVGEVVAGVTEEANQDADLLLVGRGVLSSTLGRLRTHTFGIIQRSPCPVVSI
jgi:nucleotide-binding universal stress UspA family protein